MCLLIEKEKIQKRKEKRLKKKIRLLDLIENVYVEFLTITYKDVLQYLNFKKKKKFHSLMNNLKKNYGVISYFWVLEMQKRGVPHYHVLLLRDKRNKKKIGFIDKNKYYKQYVGYTNIKRVWSKVYSYLMKYLQKEKEKNELVSRRYGFGGCIRSLREYKEIIKKGIDKILEKHGYERKNKNEIESKTGKIKIKYRFNVEFSREGLKIYGVDIQVYEKKYNLWIPNSGGYFEIEKEEDINFVYNSILNILLEEDKNERIYGPVYG